MAVSAHCMIAVYVPVTVYEVIHVAVIPLTLCYDILKIMLSCFREQCEKFFCYILFCSEMVLMGSLFKKRDDFLFCPFMLNYLLIGYILTIKIFAKTGEFPRGRVMKLLDNIGKKYIPLPFSHLCIWMPLLTSPSAPNFISMCRGGLYFQRGILTSGAGIVYQVASKVVPLPHGFSR